MGVWKRFHRPLPPGFHWGVPPGGGHRLRAAIGRPVMAGGQWEMATISDVAAYTGVGVGTVSRVLNNSPKVSAATRARVRAAMEVLDYRPSPLARGLSRGRSHTIGVVVPFFTQASAVGLSSGRKMTPNSRSGIGRKSASQVRLSQ